MEKKETSYDLNKLISTYNIDNIYEQYKRLEFLEKLRNYIRLDNSRVLELGSASGEMALLLAKQAKEVVAVDGSSEFIKIAKERTSSIRNITFYETYFETMKLHDTFDCLVLHHILEHVENPEALMPKLMELMHEESIVAITVPNAFALSRQLAVEMGLLSSVYELTPNDTHHGHYRVYDWEMMEHLIVNSGFKVIGKHGLSFKLFSDKQNMEMINTKIIGEDQIKGLWYLGDKYPDIAGAIMIVAKK